MKIFYDRDTDLNVLRSRKIAVIGYGSQGFAQSNNLRESGCDVVVGLRRESPSWAKAESSGLAVMPVAQAAVPSCPIETAVDALREARRMGTIVAAGE